MPLLTKSIFTSVVYSVLLSLACNKLLTEEQKKQFIKAYKLVFNYRGKKDIELNLPKLDLPKLEKIDGETKKEITLPKLEKLL